MRREQLNTVHEVLYYDPRSSGAAGDCTHIARFRSLRAAQSFANGKECYGKPATVQTDDSVPDRLYDRWTFQG